MPQTFSKYGLNLLYPDNWAASDNSSDELRQVTMMSEQTAVWDFYSFSKEDDNDESTPQDVLDQFVESLQEQYDEFESQTVEVKFGDKTFVGVEADFYCEALLATAHVFVFDRPDEIWVVNYQAESREFDEVETVFAAITTGLLREPQASGS